MNDLRDLRNALVDLLNRSGLFIGSRGNIADQIRCFIDLRPACAWMTGICFLLPPAKCFSALMEENWGFTGMKREASANWGSR